MRKSILSILALVLVLGSAGFVEARDNPTYESWTNASANIGKESNPVRILKLGRNGGNGANQTSIVSGDALVYDTVSDDGVSIALNSVSADNAFAGIAVTSIPTSDTTSTSITDDLGRKNWGWYVVHGPADANISAGGTNTNAAGDPFITSTDAGRITGVQPSDTARGKAYSAKGGFFYNAETTGTKAKVFVKDV